MKRILAFSLFVLSLFFAKSQTTNVFTVTNNSGTNVLTCSVTLIDLTVSTTVVPPWYFQWAGPAISATGTHVTIAQAGTYTVTMIDSLNHVVGTQTIAILANNSPPSATVSPLTQTITCGTPMATVVSTSTGNVTHTFYSPFGSSYVVNSTTGTFSGSSPGIHTVVVHDNVTGCETSLNFTVFTNNAYPSFDLTSPQSFTLGCGTKSVAVVNLTNVLTGGGGAASFTVVPFSVPPGPPGNQPSYTLNVAGNYYAIVVDNSNQCTLQIPFTIIANNSAPHLSISPSPSTSVLDCYTSQLVLNPVSNAASMTYTWTFPSSGSPAFQTTLSVSTITASPSQTIIAIYTVTGMDAANHCTNMRTIAIYQNIFPPVAKINSGSSTAYLSCPSRTLVLTNQSTTGIPPGSAFPNAQPVVGFQWLSNVQSNGSLSASYIAANADTYTLIAQDLNNGCKSMATVNVLDTCKITVGINVNKEYDNFRIFPNPSNGMYTLSNPGSGEALTLEIYNTLGMRILKQECGSEKTTIDLEQRESGVYFLSLKRRNEIIYTTRLIKR